MTETRKHAFVPDLAWGDGLCGVPAGVRRRCGLPASAEVHRVREEPWSLDILPTFAPQPEAEEERIGGLTRGEWERWFRQAAYRTEPGLFRGGMLASMWDDSSIRALVAAAFAGREK